MFLRYQPENYVDLLLVLKGFQEIFQEKSGSTALLARQFKQVYSFIVYFPEDICREIFSMFLTDDVFLVRDSNTSNLLAPKTRE